MIQLRAIAPYARARDERRHSRCELCGAALAPGHAHLVDLSERSLRCACAACNLLFRSSGQRYRAIPDRYLHDPAFSLDGAAWSALQIPVRMAFFFRPSTLDRWAAFYPGPAGATESLLGLEAWDELIAACPLARLVEPDVEALLVTGDERSGYGCFLVPIAACYELVGRVKRSWRGFDGGDEAWAQIDAFFAQVRERCRLPSEEDAR